MNSTCAIGLTAEILFHTITPLMNYYFLDDFTFEVRGSQSRCDREVA
jgi:hypothetical protein